jgi:hypothetical protein
MSNNLLLPTFSTVKKLIATNTTRMRLGQVSLTVPLNLRETYFTATVPMKTSLRPASWKK